MKIAVSAGHYPGAEGAVCNGLTEHTAAVLWAVELKTQLEAYGFDAWLVPTGTLPRKIGAINAEGCDLALEIHFNSDPQHAGRGSETLYMPGSLEGEKLARAVQSRLGARFTPDRGAKEAWYRMDRPGHADFAGDVDGDEVADAFVRLTHCPAVIVEPLFIHENVMLPMAEGAKAIARGVAEYLQQ